MIKTFHPYDFYVAINKISLHIFPQGWPKLKCQKRIQAHLTLLRGGKQLWRGTKAVQIFFLKCTWVYFYKRFQKKTLNVILGCMNLKIPFTPSWRCALFAFLRYLVRTAAHPALASDPDFIEFLEKDGDLPKSTSTSALSGAGVMRLFHKVGESLEKITLRVDENDEVSCGKMDN